jgi:hypothetical protein
LQVEVQSSPGQAFGYLLVLETFAYRSMIDEHFSGADIEQAILDIILHGLLK